MIDHSDINSLRKVYEQKLKELSVIEGQRETLTATLAEKERDYLIAKTKRTTELRMDKTPVTLIKALVDGDTATFKYDYEIAKGVLEAHKANVKKIYAGIEACRSFLSTAKSEMNIR